jgi:transcriptional regulator with XRE-family HTH domain
MTGGGSVAGSPAPNTALRRLLAETGWTEEQLARAVNRAGAEAGFALRYDRSAVSHWLAGRRPWTPVRALVAETLSRVLHRTVTLADIGLDPGEGRLTCLEDPDPLTVLTRLAEASGDRRQARTAGAYSVPALAIPAWPQAVARPRLVPPPEAQARLSAGRVVAVEQMTALFADADAAFGGGHARTALASYLAHDVVPCLRVAKGSAALRRRMLGAATELTYLCGFMCFDDEQHVLAQRYYLGALDLAAENADPAAYAIGLRALSVQARALGHASPARRLAELAASIGGSHFPPGRQAFFLGQLAVARAADGDRAGALAAMSAAERLLSHAGPDRDQGAVMGSYHPASLAHQQAAMRAELGDTAGAVVALYASVRHRPPQERRSRAIISARLAELHLAQGHLEEAVATWRIFLADYPQLRSGRATAALKTMRSRLRPHASNRAASQLLAQARALTASASP